MARIGIFIHTENKLDFPRGSAGKESACNAGDLGSIPGFGKSPGEGNSYTLQYSGLENSMDAIDHGVTKSQTWLSDFRFTSLGLEVGFPGGSAGKESTCNAGDLGSIPGLGRSSGERIGYPHQYSWASLVAQMVKNPLAMWEIWVLSLDWEDPLEEGMANHSSILAWRIPMDRGAWQATVHGVTKSRTWLSAEHRACSESGQPHGSLGS